MFHIKVLIQRDYILGEGYDFFRLKYILQSFNEMITALIIVVIFFFFYCASNFFGAFVKEL